MLEEIINLYHDEYGYINNFNEVINYLHIKNINESEITDILLKINKHNLSVYDKLSKENKTQKRINKLINTSNSSLFSKDEIKMQITSDTNDDEDKDEIIDISYYKNYINNLDEINLDSIKLCLPTIYNPDFNNIINTLLLYYKKELISINSLNNASEDEEMYEYINTEIAGLQNIINLVKEYRDSFKEKNTQIEEEKRFNILFDSDTIMSDINSISVDHYSDFYTLLDSLSKNILKGVKTFNAIGANKGISEVRYNQSRIIFDKINEETYMVYYVFLKKNCDNYYHTTLISRANSYQSKKQELLKEFYESPDEYINKNNDIYNDVMSIIGPKEKCLKK